jgi:tetratricopeptide (TPR) repeat protein
MHEESLNRVRSLRTEGRFNEAIDLISQLHKDHPYDPVVTYQCASTYDSAGLEHEAVSYYELALQQGLSGEDRRGALLGLGSTHRNIGNLDQSKEILLKGVEEFQNGREFQVFLTITLFDLGEYAEAVKILLQNLAETTQDEYIKAYRRALLYYADRIADR